MMDQLKLTVLTTNSSTVQVLGKLGKTTTHNPRWCLNRNWELLHRIATDLGSQPLKLKMARANYELHDNSIEEAKRKMVIYQLHHGKESSKNQPPQLLGRTYLRKDQEIVNSNYDGEIILGYSWPEFSTHVRKKFKWSRLTFDSVNWKAFRHEAKKLNVNRCTNLLKYVYEWLPIGKILQRIDQSATTNARRASAKSNSHHICSAVQRSSDKRSLWSASKMWQLFARNGKSPLTLSAR
jgi:hypothetical protein